MPPAVTLQSLLQASFTAGQWAIVNVCIQQFGRVELILELKFELFLSFVCASADTIKPLLSLSELGGCQL